jgi:hypothetical protein
MHGGKSPVGIASPRFINGRHSKHLPSRLIERYQDSQSDPDLLNLQSEISLIDARLSELIGRIDIDGSGTLWRNLGGIVIDLTTYHDAQDLEGIGQTISRLRSTIQRANSDTAAWEEIQPLVEQRRKLVESEAKRRVQMQDMITSEKAMVLISQLTDAVVRHVRDRGALAAIAAEFGSIIARDDQTAA